MDFKIITALGLLIALSISIFFFWRTSKSKAYRHKLIKESMIGVFISLLAATVPLFFGYLYSPAKKIQLEFEEQIERLDEIKDALSNLKLYVESQQQRYKRQSPLLAN